MKANDSALLECRVFGRDGREQGPKGLLGASCYGKSGPDVRAGRDRRGNLV